eukprot:gene1177-1354_t
MIKGIRHARKDKIKILFDIEFKCLRNLPNDLVGQSLSMKWDRGKKNKGETKEYRVQPAQKKDITAYLKYNEKKIIKTNADKIKKDNIVANGASNTKGLMEIQGEVYFVGANASDVDPQTESFSRSVSWDEETEDTFHHTSKDSLERKNAEINELNQRLVQSETQLQQHLETIASKDRDIVKLFEKIEASKTAVMKYEEHAHRAESLKDFANRQLLKERLDFISFKESVSIDNSPALSSLPTVVAASTTTCGNCNTIGMSERLKEMAELKTANTLLTEKMEALELQTSQSTSEKTELQSQLDKSREKAKTLSESLEKVLRENNTAQLQEGELRKRISAQVIQEQEAKQFLAKMSTHSLLYNPLIAWSVANITYNSNGNNRGGSNIFNGLKFYLPESFMTKNAGRSEQITNRIKSHGGKRDVVASDSCIYVMDRDSFSADCDEIQAAGVLVIGLPYLEECMQKQTPLNLDKVRNHPIYSDCLSGLVVSIDGKSPTDEFVVRSLSAEYLDSLKSNVTHLVTNSHLSTKSMRARLEPNIQLVTTQWLERCWNENKLIDANDYRPPVLAGCTVCATGLMDRQQLTKLVTENGGKYIPDYRVKDISHLVSTDATSPKHKAAMNTRTKIVTPQWLHDSIRLGSIQDESLYQVDSAPPSSTGSMSSISSSRGGGLVGYVPTPMPAPISMSPSMRSLDSQQSMASIIPSTHQNTNTALVVSIPSERIPIFRDMNFVVAGFGDEDMTEIISIIREECGYVIDMQTLPTQVANMEIHYLVAQHGVNIDDTTKRLTDMSPPIVSVDFIDACIYQRCVLDHESHEVYRPFKRVNTLTGLTIVSSGYNDAEVANIKIVSKILGAKFNRRAVQGATHLVTSSTTSAKYEAALAERNISIVTIRWLYDCARYGLKLDEHDYLLDKQEQGVIVFMSTRLNNEEVAMYSAIVEALGGKVHDSYFEPSTHLITEEIDTNDSQKSVSSGIQVAPQWLIQCQAEGRRLSEKDFPPKDASSYDLHETEPEVNEEESIADKSQGKGSIIGPLLALMQNIPESNNNFTIPAMPPKKPKLYNTTNNNHTMTLRQSTKSMDLSILECEEEPIEPIKRFDDSDLMENSEEDENSQRVTYGDSSDQNKRLKLQESKPFHVHDNRTSSSYRVKEDRDHQIVLDILNQTSRQPQQPQQLQRQQPQQAPQQPQQQRQQKPIPQLVPLPSKKPQYPPNSKVYLQSGAVANTPGYTDSLEKFNRHGFIFQEDKSAVILNMTTHLVLDVPRKSEKVLMGCAAGIWMMHPMYVIEVAKRGYFDEKEYEWCYETIKKLDLHLKTEEVEWAVAARLCRLAVLNHQRPIFSETIVGFNPKAKNEAWQKIITSGGGKIMEGPEGTVFTRSQVTHMYRTKNNKDELSHGVKHIDSDVLTQCLMKGQHLSTLPPSSPY